jgi:hypothetical protein
VIQGASISGLHYINIRLGKGLRERQRERERERLERICFSDDTTTHNHCPELFFWLQLTAPRLGMQGAHRLFGEQGLCHIEKARHAGKLQVVSNDWGLLEIGRQGEREILGSEIS